MSRAWFALAVVAVLGLFYLGYGPHSGEPTAVAHGQEVKVKPLFEQPDQPRGKAAPPAASLDWELLGHKIGGVEAAAGRPSPRSYRTKIPGGWLVEVSRVASGGGRDGFSTSGTGVGLAFVPDPEHKWDGNSLP